MKRLCVVALALVLAGCGGDPPPSAPAPPSPSPTSTTPAAPVMPEGAKESDEHGAAAFMKFYLRVANSASQTGATPALATLSGKECETCLAVISKIDSIYRSGGLIEGGVWRTTRTVVAPLGAGRWLVTAQCAYSEQRTKESATGSVRSTPAGSEKLNFTLEYRSSWKVVRWTRS